MWREGGEPVAQRQRVHLLFREVRRESHNWPEGNLVVHGVNTRRIITGVVLHDDCRLLPFHDSSHYGIRSTAGFIYYLFSRLALPIMERFIPVVLRQHEAADASVLILREPAHARVAALAF